MLVWTGLDGALVTNKISYARGFPYGAPLVMVRGGAINNPNVKAYLKARGFIWQGKPVFAWTHYMHADDFREILLYLRSLGCDVVPKRGLDPNYVLDLEV